MTVIEEPWEHLVASDFAYLRESTDQPEDAALLSDVVMFPPPGVVRGTHPAGIPFPPLFHLENFSGDVTPYLMEVGRPYYRVVGSGQLAAGAYWTNALPTLADVRTSLAIRNEWNGDHGLVTLMPKTPVPGWGGIASSQPQTGFNRVAKPRWLIGGGFQLWVPRGMVEKSTGEWTVRPLSGS